MKMITPKLAYKAFLLFLLGGGMVDQVILLPAVLLVFGAPVIQGRRLFSLVMALIYLAANVAMVWFRRTHDEAWFVWFAPMFLVWFLAARWWSSRKVKEAYSVNLGTV